MLEIDISFVDSKTEYQRLFVMKSSLTGEYYFFQQKLAEIRLK